jgi:uncharacterized protein (TIGR00269 family)
MYCDHCRRETILYQPYAGAHLCPEHFIRDLERKAKRTIRQHQWICPSDRVAIALSGGKDSTALLHFLARVFGGRRDLSLFAVTIDEGIRGYRDLNRIRRLARSYDVEWVKGSFEEEFGFTLEQIVERKGEARSCSFCGVLRRSLLNRVARREGATRLALGLNLDDEAQSVLMNVLRGDAARLLRGNTPQEGLVPRIKPFMTVPEREVALYAHLHLPDLEMDRCPYAHNALRNEVRGLLNEYAYHHRATKFALVNLGEALGLEGVMREGSIRTCERCGEPCGDICRSCQIMEMMQEEQGHAM